MLINYSVPKNPTSKRIEDFPRLSLSVEQSFFTALIIIADQYIYNTNISSIPKKNIAYVFCGEDINLSTDWKNPKILCY